MITFATAVDFLLDNGYLAVTTDSKIVITNKFTREFRPVPRARLEQVIPNSPQIISREQIWKKFIDDADIPYKATGTDGRQYTIRQYSSGIADKLIRIIKSVDSYEILVKSTKQYYQSNSFKKILSNYIDQNIWRDEYERYEKSLKSGTIDQNIITASGGNRFED
jgi:hypothetical protein